MTLTCRSWGMAEQLCKIPVGSFPFPPLLLILGAVEGGSMGSCYIWGYTKRWSLVGVGGPWLWSKGASRIWTAALDNWGSLLFKLLVETNASELTKLLIFVVFRYAKQLEEESGEKWIGSWFALFFLSFSLSLFSFSSFFAVAKVAAFFLLRAAAKAAVRRRERREREEEEGEGGWTSCMWFFFCFVLRCWIHDCLLVFF